MQLALFYDLAKPSQIIANRYWESCWAGLLASIKAEVKRILSTRIDRDLYEEMLAFDSEQLITLDNTRDWRFSELRTDVQTQPCPCWARQFAAAALP